MAFHAAHHQLGCVQCFGHVLGIVWCAHFAVYLVQHADVWRTNFVVYLAVVFMNAPLTGSAMITYGFVWVGLMLMVWDGCLQMRQQRDDKAVSEASTSASSS